MATTEAPLAQSAFKVHSSSGGLTIKTGSSPVSTILIIMATTEVPSTPHEMMCLMAPHGGDELNAFMHEGVCVWP